MNRQELQDRLIWLLEVLGRSAPTSNELAAVSNRQEALAHALLDGEGLSRLPRSRAAMIQLAASHRTFTTSPGIVAPAPPRPIAPPIIARAGAHAALRVFVEPPESLPVFVHLARISALADEDR